MRTRTQTALLTIAVVVLSVVCLLNVVTIATIRQRVITLEDSMSANSYSSIGKVIGKEQNQTLYVIYVGGYGQFLVSDEQYEQIKIGDTAPKEIIERGS